MGLAQNEMKAKPALPERVRSMEGLGVAVGRWQSLEIPTGPPMGEYRRPRIEVFSYLFELVPAQKVDEFAVMPEVVADVASPAFWLLPPKHCDAAQLWLFKWFSPFEPRACER